MQCVWWKGFDSFARNNEMIRCLLLIFTVKATAKSQRTSKCAFDERRRLTRSITPCSHQLFCFLFILLVPSVPSSKHPPLVTRILCCRLAYSIPSQLAARPGSIRRILSVIRKRVSKHTTMLSLRHPFGQWSLTGKTTNQYTAMSIPKVPFAASGLLFSVMYSQEQPAI